MQTSEIASRLGIQELLARYCHTVDTGDWEAFGQLFTAEARLDFTAFSGPDGSLREAVQFLSEACAHAVHSQHSVSTIVLDLNGGTAKAYSAGQVAITWHDFLGDEQVSLLGLRYDDDLVRERGVWKIRQRALNYRWAHNIPASKWVHSTAYMPAHRGAKVQA